MRPRVGRRGFLAAGGWAAGGLAAAGLATGGLAGLAGAAPPVSAAPAGTGRPADPVPPGSADPRPGPGDPESSVGAPVHDPGAALRRLLDGNQRFATGGSRHPRQSRDRLRQLARHQHPYAIVLGCADSRVPPELLFDQGFGDVFDQRVAGAVAGDLTLGSIEYAVAELGAPLLLVLGHERCGAVTATVTAIRAGQDPPGHIASIVDALRPSVEPVLDDPGDPVENGVRASARATAAAVQRRSRIIRQHVAKHRLAIYPARYDLDSGLVTLLD